MNPLQCLVFILGIGSILLLWRHYRREQMQKNKILRKRVAFMLWRAARRVHAG